MTLYLETSCEVSPDKIYVEYLQAAYNIGKMI